VEFDTARELPVSFDLAATIWHFFAPTVLFDIFRLRHGGASQCGSSTSGIAWRTTPGG
jgi:hypothetical protein